MFDRLLTWLGTGETARRRIRHFYSKYRRPFLLGTVALVVTNALILAIPWVIKQMIDGLSAAQPDTDVLLQQALLIIGLALGGNLARVASRLYIFNTGRQIEYELRNALFERVMRYPLSAFSRRSPGDLMSRSTNDLGSVRMLFGFGLLNLVNTAVVFVTAFTLMWTINARLTLASILIYPFFIGYVRRFSRKMFELTIKTQEQLGAISNTAQEDLNGIQVVKSFTMEARQAARFAASSRKYLEHSVKLAVTRGVVFALMQSVGRVSLLIILVYGGWLMIGGAITRGDFVAFNTYLAMMVWPMLSVGFLISMWQRGMAALGRIEEVLEDPIEAPTLAPPAEMDDSAFKGAIVFKGLTFDYPVARDGDKARPAALQEITLKVQPGETLAVVGPTGSGKSTLGAVLLRLYDVAPEQVLIGGVDITRIPLERLRRHVGFVTQNHFLFSTSISDNIAFGQESADEALVHDMARAADLAKDVGEFPQGYGTVVGERGITLSGGQRQRVTLARALLYDPDILVLDDVFSNVDLKTEENILGGLKARLGRKTTLLITHRIATAARADRVALIENGRLMAVGTHAQLMASNPRYAGMAQRQALEAELERAAS